MTKKKDKDKEPPMMKRVQVVPPETHIKLEGDENDLTLEKENGGDEGGFSFFRKIIDNLFSPNNVSAKTEYVSGEENLYASMLEFVAVYGDVPAIKEFIRIFETKRISLKRQGRIEIIKALEKRQEEMDYQRNQQMINGPMGRM